MQYIIGVDGGGTKTAFALATTDGAVLRTLELDSTSYREHGIEKVIQRLEEGVVTLLQEVGAARTELVQLAIGAPGFGENARQDAVLEQNVTAHFAPIPVHLCNDAVVAYYGALEGRPGINLVAGTGAIAYGENAVGANARSGGWSEHFSDEGSCYWLGKMAMGLFCKEADGRKPKAALYEIFRREFALEDDMSFIAVMEQQYLPYRKKVASLQRFLLEAARQGDDAAAELYTQACAELAQMAVGIRRQVEFDGICPVSLTGGITHAGALVWEPLSRMLEQHGMKLVPGAGSPVEGAAILAARVFAARSR